MLKIYTLKVSIFGAIQYTFPSLNEITGCLSDVEKAAPAVETASLSFTIYSNRNHSVLLCNHHQGMETNTFRVIE